MYVENLEKNNSLKWALFIKVSGQDFNSDHIGQWNEVSIVRYKKRCSKCDNQVIDGLLKTTL